MKMRLIIHGLAGIAIIPLITITPTITTQADEPVPAEDKIAVSTDACKTAINIRLAHELRTYRSVLFGRKPAIDAEIGEVRFGKDAEAYYKIAKDKWILIKDYKSEEEQSDDDLYIFDSNTLEGDPEDDDPPRILEDDSIPPEEGGVDFTVTRRGIFETKRVLTTELIPYLAQAMRTFACRADMVCEQAHYSINYAKEDDTSIPAGVAGCITADWEPLHECLFSANCRPLSDFSIPGPSLTTLVHLPTKYGH